jgi:hypothetical protein
MRSSDSRRSRSPVRSDILQILGGLLLAVCLIQADRALSARGPEAALYNTVLTRQTLAFSAHVVRLEVDHLVAILSRAISAIKVGNKIDLHALHLNLALVASNG